LNLSIPAYGPQLIKILVGLVLFDSIIIGTVVIRGAMQGGVSFVEEEDELELVAVAQVGPVIELLLRVTAAVRARALPFRLAPAAKVMLVSARMFPTNELLASRVAVLTTRHHTLHGKPPPVKTTLAELPVITRSLADLKIQTPDESPLSVSVPDDK
jgi:hypothetical protein